jgi:hypothetical protein
VAPDLSGEMHGVRSHCDGRDDRPMEATMTMTRDDIISVLGPADDALIAEIAATGSTIEELREAFAWIGADEALLNEGRPLPTARVVMLIDLLEAADDEEPL